MPTPTYVPLATITLTSTEADIVFSSIPATYRDLVIIIAGNQTVASTNGGFIRLNGDSGSNYSHVHMTGSGSSTSSAAQSGNNRFIDSLVFNNTITAHTIQIMDYSATDKHKTILTRVNTSDWGVRAYAGRYASTSAITSVTLAVEPAPVFVSGTTLSLYGIVA